MIDATPEAEARRKLLAEQAQAERDVAIAKKQVRDKVLVKIII